MANNIEMPVAAGLIIATDEVTSGGDTAHAQYVKLMDGRGSSAAPLAIEPNGALRSGASVLKFFGAPTIAQAGGYNAGDVVGEPVDLGTYPQGVIASMELSMLSMAGLTLPALDLFILQAVEGTLPGDVGVDGDAFAPPALLGMVAIGSNAADFEPIHMDPNIVRWSATSPLLLTDGATVDEPAQWILVMRAGATFTDDLTAGVAVLGWGQFLHGYTVPAG